MRTRQPFDKRSMRCLMSRRRLSAVNLELVLAIALLGMLFLAMLG